LHAYVVILRVHLSMSSRLRGARARDIIMVKLFKVQQTVYIKARKNYYLILAYLV